MNIHGMPQPNLGVSPVMMQQSSPQQIGNIMNPQVQMQNQAQQQQQQQQQQAQQAEKIDNISKIKSLLVPLRESLFLTLRSAALALQQNNNNDNLKRDPSPPPRFEKHLEDFYSYCDQIELHLKTAIQCIQQLTSAQHYLPGVVAPVRMEPYMQQESQAMPYPQYLNTVRSHVQSTKDIHDTLISAAQNISQAD